ncbi:hypothetical protein IKF32_02540 [Candidatus Saccharibacteria bacterium]|nr:hypothetical protein [Candidatus Saccharibacteria bacterium]
MNKERNVLFLAIEENRANISKQKLWREYKKAKERARQCNDRLTVAWQKKVHLKERIDAEVDRMKVNPEHENTWKSFHDFREAKSVEIADLIRRANKEHGLMLEEFDLAKDQESNSSAAFAHNRKGYYHKKQRNLYNEQVKKLIAEIGVARDEAETKAAMSKEYLVAKKEYEEATSEHSMLLSEYKALKSERDRKRKAFVEAQKKQELVKNKLTEEADKSRFCTKFN